MKSSLLAIILICFCCPLKAQQATDELIIGTWKLIEEYDNRPENDTTRYYRRSNPVKDSRIFRTYMPNGEFNAGQFEEVGITGKYYLKEGELIRELQFHTNEIKGSNKDLNYYIKRYSLTKKSDGHYYFPPDTEKIKSITKDRLEIGNELYYRVWIKVKPL